MKISGGGGAEYTHTDKESLGVGVRIAGRHLDGVRAAVLARERAAMDVSRHACVTSDRPHRDAHVASKRHLDTTKSTRGSNKFMSVTFFSP